jgi:hypothetical protein
MTRKSMTVAVLSALALSAAYAAPTMANDMSKHEGATSGSSLHGKTSGSAAAQSGDVGGAMNEMVKADVNKDGNVTRDEVQKIDPSLAKNFDQADANHDGKLSLREFETLRGTSVGGTSGSSMSGSTSGGSRSGSRY